MHACIYRKILAHSSIPPGSLVFSSAVGDGSFVHAWMYRSIPTHFSIPQDSLVFWSAAGLVLLCMCLYIAAYLLTLPYHSKVSFFRLILEWSVCACVNILQRSYSLFHSAAGMSRLSFVFCGVGFLYMRYISQHCYSLFHSTVKSRFFVWCWSGSFVYVYICRSIPTHSSIPLWVFYFRLMLECFFVHACIYRKIPTHSSIPLVSIFLLLLGWFFCVCVYISQHSYSLFHSARNSRFFVCYWGGSFVHVCSKRKTKTLKTLY